MSNLLPSDELRAGRRAIDGLHGIEILEDWRRFEGFERWGLRLRLTIDPGGPERVPASTDWEFLVDKEYPLGDIAVAPADDGGIEKTFHHQRCNRENGPGIPWRTGHICVETDVRGLDRYVQNEEPWTAPRRLRWYVQRARAWLEAAAGDDLMRAGDPFELPDFPITPETDCAVAFREDAASYAYWEALTNRSGVFEYPDAPAIPSTVLVQRFLNQGKRRLVDASWGRRYRIDRPVKRGPWVRLPQIPVLEPWRAPITWGQLEAACAGVGVDFMALLEPLSHQFRERARNPQPHIGLIGFPIPMTTGQAPVQMHWQAFMLPVLASGTEHPKGFRPTLQNQWLLDRRTVLAPDTPIEWLKTANWSPDEISARGRLPLEVRVKSVAVIGAGALGSAVAELLARAGVGELFIVDGDTLEMGNLVRHSLTMSDLGKSKAEAVANRLGRFSPNIDVVYATEHFVGGTPGDLERLHRAEVIVDTSASDEVIAGLASIEWSEPKMVISVSLSLAAKRLYVFSDHSTRFPAHAFHQWIDPLLVRDADEAPEDAMPHGHKGCWHPVFRTRADDVWLLAAAAVKEIEEIVRRSANGSHCRVFEQVDSEDGFGGLQRL